MSFRWDVAPEQSLIPGLRAYEQKVRQAVEAVAQRISAQLAADAKANAAWRDQSGAARAGLASAVEVASDIVTIYLFHTVNYGPYLERSRGGRYAVIMPSIERAGPQIRAALESIFR
jgi:hypothetical protein